MPSWRSQFPCFKSSKIAFLDSAASAQKPKVVLKAMADFARKNYANIHRGVHSLAEISTAAYEAARAVTAAFIGASDADSIVFTQGTTAAVNLVADASCGSFLKKGDTIAATALEHHSNYLPWQRAAHRLGTFLETVPLLPFGDVDLSAIESLFKKGIKLLAITHASNVLGTVPALKEIIALAHKHGARVFVDGAQAVAHMPVDVAALGADFYAFSGHKLYGPTGIGVLYIRPEIAKEIPPWQLGGGMVHKVGEDFLHTTWAPSPHRFEAGTPPIIEAVGLAAAIRFVEKIGFEKIQKHEVALTAYALERLREIGGLTIYGSPAQRIGVISFNLDDLHPHDVGSILSAQGVAVRVGHHCAQPLMKELGILGCVRASIGLYNSEKDIDRLIEGLRMARKKLG